MGFLHLFIIIIYSHAHNKLTRWAYRRQQHNEVGWFVWCRMTLFYISSKNRVNVRNGSAMINYRTIKLLLALCNTLFLFHILNNTLVSKDPKG